MPNAGAHGGLASLRPAVLGMARVIGLGLSSVAAAPLNKQQGHHADDDFEGTPKWILLTFSMALVLLGGAFAGLTIAYVASRPATFVLPLHHAAFC